MKSAETQSSENRRGNSNWRSESGRAFKECSKGKSNQQRLHIRVGGNVTDGVFKNFELAGLDRDAIKNDGPEDNPEDGKNTEGCAVKGSIKSQQRGHAVGH